MNYNDTCTFRHALRAAYRTAISAAQILVNIITELTEHCVEVLLLPRVGSGVVRIDPLHFLAGFRTRRLNQVYLCLSYILACFIVLLFSVAPFYVLLVFVAMYSVFWLFSS